MPVGQVVVDGERRKHVEVGRRSGDRRADGRLRGDAHVGRLQARAGYQPDIAGEPEVTHGIAGEHPVTRYIRAALRNWRNPEDLVRGPRIAAVEDLLGSERTLVRRE